MPLNSLKTSERLPSGSVVKNLPSKEGFISSIPYKEIKVPNAVGTESTGHNY